MTIFCFALFIIYLLLPLHIQEGSGRVTGVGPWISMYCQRRTWCPWWFLYNQVEGLHEKERKALCGWCQAGNGQRGAHTPGHLFTKVERFRAPKAIEHRDAVSTSRIGMDWYWVTCVWVCGEYIPQIKRPLLTGREKKLHVTGLEQIKNILKMFSFCLYCVLTLLLVISPLTC